MIVLPVSADTYFELIHVWDVKGSDSHAVRWRGCVLAPLSPVWAPGGLFLTLRWSSAGQRWSIQQTGRAHLLQHPAGPPLWKHRPAGVGLGVTDMYHNKWLKPSVMWSLGFYLALSSLWSISSLSTLYSTLQTIAAEELERQQTAAEWRRTHRKGLESLA